MKSTKNEDNTMKIDEHNYRTHPDRGVTNLILSLIMFGGLLFTLSMVFFFLKTDLGRAFSTDADIREWILTYFPQAQYWVNSTLQYKQEIVLIYFFYIFSLGLSLSPLIYMMLFNQKKLLVLIKLWFIRVRIEKKLCENMPKFILLLIFFIGWLYIFMFVAYPGSVEPMSYEDFSHSTGYRGISEYNLWNTFGGLTFIVFIKAYMSMSFLYIVMFSFFSMALCFFKKT